MAKLGMSLSPELLKETPKNEGEAVFLRSFGSVERLLRALRDKGIVSVEFRNIPRTTGNDWDDLYKLLWEHGLEVTIHGRLEGPEVRPQGERLIEQYPSIRYALEHFHRYQEQLVINIHAYSGREESREELARRTVETVGEWARLAAREFPGVRFALELNRNKPPKTDPGDHIYSLQQMIGQLPEEQVGIGWDMGHYYANLLRFAGYDALPAEWQPGLPAESFVRRTIHTHIHGLNDRGTTHFPLRRKESLPLEAYVQCLQRSGYQGVYNIELDFNRFAEIPDMLGEVYATIERLQDCFR